MASLLPDGSLYDRNGIQPDILKEATVDDWLGKSDLVLDQAVARLAG